MSRCPNTKNLEVHHKRVDGGNKIENTEVLCQTCHENTASYGVAGRESPPDFEEKTKSMALYQADNQCSCTRKCPHHSD